MKTRTKNLVWHLFFLLFWFWWGAVVFPETEHPIPLGVIFVVVIIFSICEIVRDWKYDTKFKGDG